MQYYQYRFTDNFKIVYVLYWPYQHLGVAPRRGAWIEIVYLTSLRLKSVVVLLAGAWIEILVYGDCIGFPELRHYRVHGLKWKNC